jgi:outer membrane protein OmpA-like peptidoglycan-associated protein
MRNDFFSFNLRRKRSQAFVFYLSLLLFFSLLNSQSKDIDKENWEISPQFGQLCPKVIAVVPMINMSLEEGVSEALQDEVYKRLQALGYRKIAAERVAQIMEQLGIQTPEQLAGISYKKIGAELNCDAVIQGQVNQSGTQHQGVYDAVVVSVSLQLVHCETGSVLWRCEQWRTAHRQWQIDPFNFVINLISHENASREERIAWLVQEMLRTLPRGSIEVVFGEDLLSRAIEIDISEPLKKLNAEVDKEFIRIKLASDILFDFDKYVITADAENILKNLIPILNKYDRCEVSIIGHTDSIGNNAYNDRLSLQRANACRDWILQNIAMKYQTFASKGMGESRPLVPNDSPENRKKNRRVEIAIKKNDEIANASQG